MNSSSLDAGEYRLTFSVSADRVELPVTEHQAVCEHDTDLEAWAQDKARTLLGADAAPERAGSYATVLTTITYLARAEGAQWALVLYVHALSKFAASLTVRHFAGPRGRRPLSARAVRRAYAGRSSRVEETQLELASGPAYRLRRTDDQKPQDGAAAVENLIYAIWPRGTGDTVLLHFTYRAEHRRPLAPVTEAIAASVRLGPAGDAGEGRDAGHGTRRPGLPIVWVAQVSLLLAPGPSPENASGGTSQGPTAGHPRGPAAEAL